MVYKVFLDANILLDLALKRGKYDVSKQIIQLAIEGSISAFITPAIVHIVAYWLGKAYGKQKSKELILSFLADIKVIDANHELTISAIYSKIDDIEDALQYFTAMHHKMDYFLTSDKPLIKMSIPALPALTPEDFLKDVMHI